MADKPEEPIKIGGPLSSSIPKCVSCEVKHPWLLSVNEMVKKIEFECDECGTVQKRVFRDSK